jgi:hypothetical protein
MLVYVTLPGMKKEPITVPDAATLADFCREVFHRTGVSLFNGFGFKNLTDGSTYTVPTSARVNNIVDLDLGAAGAGTSNVSLTNTTYSTAVKTNLWADGDEIVLLDIMNAKGLWSNAVQPQINGGQ